MKHTGVQQEKTSSHRKPQQQAVRSTLLWRHAKGTEHDWVRSNYPAKQVGEDQAYRGSWMGRLSAGVPCSHAPPSCHTPGPGDEHFHPSSFFWCSERSPFTGVSRNIIRHDHQTWFAFLKAALITQAFMFPVCSQFLNLLFPRQESMRYINLVHYIVKDGLILPWWGSWGKKRKSFVPVTCHTCCRRWMFTSVCLIAAFNINIIYSHHFLFSSHCSTVIFVSPLVVCSV